MGLFLTAISEPPAILSMLSEYQMCLQDTSPSQPTVFGHRDFKGKQKAIVEAAVAGRDVFVLAPTGMGKSLCFQLPAVMAKAGVTLVISPLCALMSDQVENLQSKGVNVVAWMAETRIAERQEIEKDLVSQCPRLRLLYITPEKYATSECTRLLDQVYENRNLNRLVIDEAHCISEWGHSFRNDYRGLGKFRDRYPDVPIMALTATATQVVQRDILHNLKMNSHNLYHVVHPFNRNNLFYEVRYSSTLEPNARMQEVFDYITLLYQRRNRASSGLNAKPYHRGINTDTLKQTLKNWSAGGHGEPGGVDLVVATVAFGLGIDKGEVRYIIHYDIPASFEGYYQETGRAGRDGLPSKCILYYSREDAHRIRELVATPNSNRLQDGFDGPSPTQRAKSSIDELIQFAENATACRHIIICRYFGENIDSNNPEVVKKYCNNMCDVCKYPQKTQMRIKILTPQSTMNWLEPPKSRQVININSNAPPSCQAGRAAPIDNKRGNIENSTRNAKKAKVSSTRPLTTIPFGSAKILAKPFKPPSKISSNHQSEIPPPEPQIALTANLVKKVGQHLENPLPKASSVEPVPRAVHLHLFDIEVELENPSSSKVEPARRKAEFNKIRRGLSALNFDQLMGSTGAEQPKWEHLVYHVAREIEFTALSLSSTTNGYIDQIESSNYDDDVVDDIEDIKIIVQKQWKFHMLSGG